MDEQKSKKPTGLGTPQSGLILAACGAIIALMLIFLGFWKTLFVAALAGVGYYLGAVENKPESLKRILNKLFPPKSE